MISRWPSNRIFIFDASVYVSVGYEKSCGEFSSEERDLFSTVRIQLPELSQWGDLAIGTALEDFFQQVHLISWLKLTDNQLERPNLMHFLAFLHYQQTVGEWPWGGDIDKLNELVKQGAAPTQSDSTEKTTPLTTNIGDLEGFLFEGDLIVWNGDNNRLSDFLLDSRPVSVSLNNLDNHLFVVGPDEFKGQWEFTHLVKELGDACTPYPLRFRNVKDKDD